MRQALRHRGRRLMATVARGLRQPLRKTGRRQRTVMPDRSALHRRGLWLQMLICIGAILATWILAAAVVSPWWAVLAMGLFVWLCGLLFALEPRGTALLLPIITLRFSVILSLVSIEFGSPIPELGTVGNAGAHTIAYVFYMAIMLGGYTAAFPSLAAAMAPRKDTWLASFYDRHADFLAVVVLAVVGLATLVLILQGLRSGFPLLTGTDRYLFRRTIAAPLAANILAFKSLFCFPLGLVAFVTPVGPALRATAWLLFGVFILVSFLFGDKFFIIIAAAELFLAPYIVTHPAKVRAYLGRYLVAATLSLMPLFALTWYMYSDGGRQNASAVVQRLNGRIAGQGELWYLQHDIGAPYVNWDQNFVDRNVAALDMKDFNYPLKASIGPAYFSNRYAPDRIRASMSRQGGIVTYTMAMEPLGLAVLGWIGLAGMMALVGIMFAFFAAFSARAITAGSVLTAAMAGYLEQLVRSMTSQGAPWVLFGFSVLKWLAVVLLTELVLSVLSRMEFRRARRIEAPRPRRSEIH